jgi:phosphohistidine swiveling domain-containing protein
MKKTNPKWDIDEAEAIYWICPEAAWAMTVGMRKIYGFGFDRNLVILEKNQPFRWSTLIKDNIVIGNKCYNKFKAKKFRAKIKIGLAGLKSKLDKKILEYRQKNPSAMSVDALFGHLDFFTKCYKEMFSYGFFAEAFDYVLPRIFEKELMKYKLSSDEFSDSAAIPDISYLNLEAQKLIRLAIKKRSGRKIQKDLDNHLKKYEWLATGHSGKKLVDADYFAKRINELIKQHKNLTEELKHLADFKKNLEKRKKQIIKKYKFDKKTRQLIDIVDEIGPLRDRRKEIFVKSIFYADDIREELAKRFGYRLSDLQFFTLEELLVLKNGKSFNLAELKKRKEFMILDVDYQKKFFKVYSGNDAKKRIPKEFKKIHGRLDKISGTVASGGKVSGEVKVIFGESGFYKMKSGDILVTGMTRPEMLPIMKKAAAIVTDEGGLTCHAAIVARELKIPCIVGTKISTKILKDGDKVEVDADNGVVRKI